MIVKPFRGLRPRPDLAARIPSYPYDVVSREEAFRLAEGDPYSFLHIVRAEIDLDPHLSDDRPVDFMGNLKYLSVVMTKSDMIPIIYPPADYPDQKLPQCVIHVRAIENYLKLCGGEIRYYNASATGYSFLRDTLYYPGKENTLTPINVIEPIFDMMNIE